MTRPHTLLSTRLIGFDALSDMIDRMATQTQKTFPPTNVLRLGADRYRIDLALAGYAQEDLTIEVQNDTLRVAATTKAPDESQEDEEVYLHKGISLRSFSREFHLVPHIRVTGAAFTNGMLSIDLERETPEALRPQTIAIKAGGTKDARPTDQADGGEDREQEAHGQ